MTSRPRQLRGLIHLKNRFDSNQTGFWGRCGLGGARQRHYNLVSRVDSWGRSGLRLLFPHRCSARRLRTINQRSFEAAGLYLADNGSSAKVVNSILGEVINLHS